MSLNHVCLFGTLWTVARQAPLSMEFSRQEYCSRLLLPSVGDLPNPGIEPGLLHCRQTLDPLSHQGSSLQSYIIIADKRNPNYKSIAYIIE